MDIFKEIKKLGGSTVEVGKFFHRCSNTEFLSDYSLDANLIKDLIEINGFKKIERIRMYVAEIIIKLIIKGNYTIGLLEAIERYSDVSWDNLFKIEVYAPTYPIRNLGVKKVYELVSGNTSEEKLFNQVCFLSNAGIFGDKSGFIENQLINILSKSTDKTLWSKAVNSNIGITDSIIMANIFRIDLSKVGDKRDLFISDEFLSKYGDLVNWDRIINNPKICDINHKYLEQYKDKINWDELSKKNNLPKVILKKFKECLNWDFIIIHNFYNFIKLDNETIDYVIKNKVLNHDFMYTNLSLSSLKKFKEYINWDEEDIYRRVNASTLLHKDIIKYVSFGKIINRGGYKYSDVSTMLEYYKSFIGHCNTNGINIEKLYKQYKLFSMKSSLLSDEEIELVKIYEKIKIDSNDIYEFAIDELNLIKYRDILDLKKVKRLKVSKEFLFSIIDELDIKNLSWYYINGLNLEDKKILILKFGYKSIEELGLINKSQENTLIKYAKNINKY